jgi:tetratricopeptide (TPR) repeat protein
LTAWLLVPVLGLALGVQSEAAALTAAGSPADIFEAANTAYSEERYQEAAEGYRGLIDAGLDHSKLWYNLGNAQLRAGDLGPAIASLLRARARSPRDSEIAANLAFARSSVRDAIAPPEPGEVAGALFFWRYALSASETWWLVLASMIVAGALLALLQTRRDSDVLRWATCFALALLLAAAASLASYRFRPRDVAVVLPLEVEVYSGTRVDTVVRFKLHAGSEVAVTDIQNDWVRIELPDGEQGWLQAEQVEVVRL